MGQQLNQEQSPLVNFTYGGGCGCGCLGTLVMFFATVLLGGIPLGFYTSSAHSQVMVGGGGCLLSGLLIAVIGVGMYLASFWIEYREEEAKLEAWKKANAHRFKE